MNAFQVGTVVILSQPSFYGTDESISGQKMAIPFKKKRLVLPAAYNNRWRRLLWQALRSERLQFPNDGREGFADHIAETIFSALPKIQVEGHDGTEFIGHQHLPTPETYNNFLKNGLSPVEGRISGRTSTLHVVHLYLWLRRPAALEGWNKPTSNRNLDDFVAKMDSSFSTHDPKSTIPVATRLFKMRRNRMRDLVPVEGFYKSATAETTANQSKNARQYLGELNPESGNYIEFWGIVFPLYEGDSNRAALYFSGQEWQAIEATFFDDENSGKFNFVASRKPLDSIVFETRSVALGAGYSKPEVMPRKGCWVIKMKDCLSGDDLFAKIDSISPFEGDEWFWKIDKNGYCDPNWVIGNEENFDWSDQLMATSIFHHRSKDHETLWPVPVLKSDLELLNLLTGRSE